MEIVDQFENVLTSVCSNHLKRIIEILGYILGLLCGFIWKETIVFEPTE